MPHSSKATSVHGRHAVYRRRELALTRTNVLEGISPYSSWVPLAALQHAYYKTCELAGNFIVH